jgi:hypothetical protein
MRKRKDLESMLFKGINIPSVYHPDFCCFLTKTMALWESLGYGSTCGVFLRAPARKKHHIFPPTPGFSKDPKRWSLENPGVVPRNSWRTETICSGRQKIISPNCNPFSGGLEFGSLGIPVVIHQIWGCLNTKTNSIDY